VTTYEIAVVGTSWGGLSALRELVGSLPLDLVIPVVLVQHRHKHSDYMLPSLLQDRTRLRVCEVEDKAPIEPGAIYVAPADYHLLVEPGYFTLSVDEPIRYSRPSIDLTFSSAADVFADHAIGVVLTGANADGAEGLRRIAARGGIAIVQDPVSAESAIMPRSALQAVPGARVMALTSIGPFIGEMGRVHDRDRPRRVSPPSMRRPEATS
jgi:two-component system chemotaxis response regulator CheB